VIHSGSSVVKSVAGYDLHRLFVGGRGAFGAVLECVFKVGLLPEGRETLVFLADDLSKLAPLREELMALGPSAVALSRADGVMRLIVSFDGFREDAQASLDRLSLIMNPLKRVEHETLAADQIGEGGTSILRTVQHEWLPGPLHHAFGVPASRALDVVEALDARIPFLADLASGRIDARGDASDFIAAADRARSAGGWATVRGAIAADGTNALRARIKRAFDPNEVLRA
jgi:FAD/FMN-containing dehydrogenase